MTTEDNIELTDEQIVREYGEIFYISVSEAYEFAKIFTEMATAANTDNMQALGGFTVERGDGTIISFFVNSNFSENAKNS